MDRMSRSNPARVPERAKEVLSYFLRNPHAADTLEGVARWRVHQEAIYRSVEEIDRALAWLVAEGFLARESTASSPPIFWFNRVKAAEARSFLSGDGRGTGGDAGE